MKTVRHIEERLYEDSVTPKYLSQTQLLPGLAKFISFAHLFLG